MPLFRPINLTNGVTLYDSNWPMDRDRRQGALDVLYAEFHRLVDEVAETVDTEPGCHRMWKSKDSRAFLDQRDKPGGVQHFSEYRANLLTARTLSGLHGTSRTLLAWKQDTPVGGAVFYNDKIVGTGPGGLLEFESHYGPFLNPPALNREFFEFMLKHEVRAEDDDGMVIRVQLMAWRHDSAEPANRWSTSHPSSLIWADIDGLEGVFERVDGKRVRQTTRKSLGNG